jgi:putative two-component system response regulator
MEKTRILIVEDESITARDLQLTLQELGYEVAAKASSGKEAVKEAEARKPDLVLMDIFMPGEVDGIEAARQINERLGIPVVYLTAHTEEETISRAKITVPYGYIVKPFNDRDLRSNIEMALYKNRIERQLGECHRRLQNSLRGMIDLVSELIRVRDPYLYRRQEKVTRLARAIAEEMGISPGRIEGVELGARICGLGLLTIPVDILAQQGMLTGSYLAIYRQYPKVGYDLLKRVDFPWPVAEIVLQHRELLDGSGFPDGLRGDAIIQEARIVCLAYAVVDMLATTDVVAPPTTPAKDLLDKIDLKKGNLYDAQAVEAFTRLIREKGFTLDQG